MIVTLRPVDTVSSDFAVAVPPTAPDDYHTLVDEVSPNTTDYIKATADGKFVEFEMDDLPAGVDRILTITPFINSAGDNPSGGGITVRVEVRLNGVVVCSAEFEGDNDLSYFNNGIGVFDVNILATDWNAGLKTVYIKEIIP